MLRLMLQAAGGAGLEESAWSPDSFWGFSWSAVEPPENDLQPGDTLSSRGQPGSPLALMAGALPGEETPRSHTSSWAPKSPLCTAAAVPMSCARPTRRLRQKSLQLFSSGFPELPLPLSY